MNYRHAYHAGNFADVHKHVALTAMLLHLRKKEKPFAVIDTHAGGGVYSLAGQEAEKTGEAAGGIAKLRGYPAQSASLAEYLKIVSAAGPARYPGSPLVSAGLLRPQDRLIAVEKHPEEFERLRRALAGFPNARAMRAGGYERLVALLPPRERRGLILIDPPYEDREESERLARAFAQAYRRFANGIFLIWSPLKAASGIEALAGEVFAAGATKLLSLTIDAGRNEASPDRLSAAGLLAVNPPFGFDAEMRAASSELLPLLARGAGANASVEWVSPGSFAAAGAPARLEFPAWFTN